MTSEKSTPYWQKGDQSKIARAIGVPLPNINAILHRKKGVSVEKAKRLERAVFKLFKKNIPWTDWIDNKETKHPAFYGSPIKPGGKR